MNGDDMEKVKMALNALEKLRQSEDKLSEPQKAHLDRVRECLRTRDFDSAKLGLVKMLEESRKPEELWLALALVLLALGESDISRLADFVTGSKSNQEDKDGYEDSGCT